MFHAGLWCKDALKIFVFGFETSKNKKQNAHAAFTFSRGNAILTIKFHWP